MARVLALAVVPLVAALASDTSLPCWAWAVMATALLLAVLCKLTAGRLYRRPPEPQLRPDKPSHRVLNRPPGAVSAGW